ncbi:hypothetical protein [Catellatospora citrea]|uniref:Uncharacterized protein n=1 Tax=Catellatospora citrea TaxID=53366 RepID=A0A8J3KPK1_9ACTN|nr:hypothetical protein [Catellatospora citrea]RKE10467.1 hypothetical protein C8E86_5370 [Catellatospora citrea]GIF99024.1 hypothetical protein Cci01nite_41180 [Catellatospora citrea]
MTATRHPDRQTTWIRRLLVAAGVLAAAYGIIGVLTDPSVYLPNYARYTITVLFGHDLLVLPAAIVVGAVLTRWLPAWARPVVQGALFVTAVLTVVALPLVLGFGRTADNPSALPRDYPRGYAICLAVIWLVTAGLLAVRALRRHRSTTDPNTREHL